MVCRVTDENKKCFRTIEKDFADESERRRLHRQTAAGVEKWFEDARSSTQRSEAKLQSRSV